jgi:hypothetical protein
MPERLIVLAFVGSMSMSASAAYVWCDLKDVTADGGMALTGWFVQDTSNLAIPFYDIRSVYQNYIPGFDSCVTSATITVPGGPTSFRARSENNVSSSASMAAAPCRTAR